MSDRRRPGNISNPARIREPDPPPTRNPSYAIIHVMTTPLALAIVVVLGALASLFVWLYLRTAPRENTDKWPVTEATIHSVNKVIGSGRDSYPFDVGDFSYVVDDENYSGRATISRTFTTGDSQPKDLVDKKFQVRYNPRKPDKFDLSQADVGGFLLEPYDDFLMNDIGPTNILDN
jgi:hypothetical protein